ncbi:MAG TPA: YkgJ family cysteine cluster protein [Acidimicrobiales bacterium]|nr:YkgJ family cysteine cluster protein [Acidimicrobiales bacterium]
MPASAADHTDLPAGDFSRWLAAMTAALRGERAAEVPCNGCTACCTASQFVLIEPDETDTLAHIPSELLFPAPRRPGHVLLGYDERGHCPMLVAGRCTIYAHRPRACRTYDCRVLPAAGLTVDGPEKSELARRVGRWRFRYDDAESRQRHDAVRAAAAYLLHHAAELPPDAVPTNEAPLAALAVELHDAFLADDEPAVATVRVALRRRRPGEAGGGEPAFSPPARPPAGLG